MCTITLRRCLPIFAENGYDHDGFSDASHQQLSQVLVHLKLPESRVQGQMSLILVVNFKETYLFYRASSLTLLSIMASNMSW